MRGVVVVAHTERRKLSAKRAATWRKGPEVSSRRHLLVDARAHRLHCDAPVGREHPEDVGEVLADADEGRALLLDAHGVSLAAKGGAYKHTRTGLGAHKTRRWTN